MTDEQKKDDCPCAPGMVRNKEGKCVLPEVTFTTFIMALNTSALYHLGELADPVSGVKQKDLMMAKHTIDTINMLKKKTSGNLTGEEAELVSTTLYDLKMRYVNANS